MLKPKALPKVLEQANSHGVLGSLLFRQDGALIASAVVPGKEESISRAVSAIVSNLMASFDQHHDIEYLLIECEDGNAVVTKVNKLLLCLYGKKSAELGLLKSKAHTIRSYLEVPLQQVLM
eukprot:TRINITY_DN628_c0_g1_i1.p1 TRINITY_DN628_c0_g1~~TRINITY_DN628_c0_g1_i1.p1  ORF type:complete len:121 (-),score=33.23 TRINITY_DN628_c0_g1_i1:54-416(-)